MRMIFDNMLLRYHVTNSNIIANNVIAMTNNEKICREISTDKIAVL
jgi:hypothetical protein